MFQDKSGKQVSGERLLTWIFKQVDTVFYDLFRRFVELRLCWYQCFGSGSMWIRIEMAPQDPDPGQSKWCKKREQNLRFQVKESIDHFVEGLMILT